MPLLAAVGMERIDKTARNGRAYYTSRDLILYSFGIGCTGMADHHHGTSDSNRQRQKYADSSEMKYLYEHDGNFMAFPTFPLSLPFRAESAGSPSSIDASSSFGMPQFPPPLMKPPVASDSGASCSRKAGPVIHLSQRYRLHQPIPLCGRNSANMMPLSLNETRPVAVDIITRVLSVVPHKRGGSIVTTETQYYVPNSSMSSANSKSQSAQSSASLSSSEKDIHQHDQHRLLLATSQSTTLFPHDADSLMKPSPEQPPSTLQRMPYPHSMKLNFKSKGNDNKSVHTRTYRISNQQALLYRLNGDTNRIHVEGSPGLFSTTQPILHGLCTLGYAVRAVLSKLSVSDWGEVWDDGDDVVNDGRPCAWECAFVECRFRRPVFVGDLIEVRMLMLQNVADGGGNERLQCVNTAENRGVNDTCSGEKIVLFEIWNAKDNVTVVDHGLVGAVIRHGSSSSVPNEGILFSRL